MASRIQIRRDTAANWSANNPTLSSGEIAFVTDENKIKVGDGQTAWNSLAYLEADAYLNSVVMGDDTTGNYVETLIASDGISISGEGAESASVTITNTGVLSLAGTTGEIDVSASSGNITLSLPTSITVDLVGDVTGNSDTASTLETARAISLGGDVSGSASFDGGSNITITATVADDSHNHTIANVDGLQTALDNNASSASSVASDLTDHENATTNVHGIADTSLLATKTYADNSASAAAAALVDSAPETLNTLNELAAALGDDPNFATTITNSLSGKQPLDSDLTAIAGLSASATGYAKKTGDGTWSVGDVALGTDTSGNYVASISGTANEVEVTGSGSESAAVTIGLPTTINANTTGSAAKLTTPREISLSGDVTGSANFDGSASVSITATVADDSHNHVISNVDGLQTALDSKLNSESYTASDVLSKIKTVDGSTSGLDSDLLDGQDGSYYLDWTNTTNKPDPTITLTGDVSGSATLTDLNSASVTVSIEPNSVELGTDTSGIYVARISTSGDGLSATGSGESASVTLTNTGVTALSGTASEIEVSASTGSVTLSLPSTINANTTGNAATSTKLATERAIALSGDVSGSANFDGSASISITATVADDSHNHIVENVDGLQSALDAKLDSASYTASDVLTKIKTVDGASSGLDADLLDGQHGSHYLDWNNTTNKPDPTITLGGDASGSLTMTDLAGGTLTVTVADDSHNHIISNVDGLQTALDAKAPLASPALSGTPTAPTASASANSTQIATTAFVQTAVSNVIDGAPGALNTLNELAAALGDDANFASTVTNSLAGKQPLDSDLTAIAGLSASATGYAKKTGDGNWSVGDVALGTDTTGNYIATISGTANEIEVTGSGSESAAVTIGLPSTINANTTGSAASLTTARTISLGGDLSGSASFNGTSNITITAAVADDSHNHIISNVDGLQTALDAKQPLDADLSAIAELSASATGLLKKEGENSWGLDTNTYLTGNQTVTISGDATGSGATSINLTLANSGVSASTYGSSSQIPIIAVDSKGRITSASVASVEGLPSQDGNSGKYLTTNGTSASWDTINLGTDTDGDYVARLSVSGSGLSLTGSGESASVTISNTGVTSLSGTANEVEVSASTGAITLSLPSTINANTTGSAATLTTSRTIELTGDVTGSASFNGGANASITATIAPNSVALGTDTTGNYVATITGTTNEIDVTGSGSENASVTLSLPSTINANTTGSAASLTTARAISLGGDLSGSASFNGEADITITAAVADDSHNHIISNVDGLQTALDAKAPLASPALSGTPTAPTASASANSTQIATTAFVQTAVSNLISGAPGALDTLDELAAALGDDANFASTVTNSLAGKQPLDADLTAIAALSGTSGFLKKTAADTWSLDTNTYLTGNQSISISGDATGSGTTSISLTLANSGVSAGTYRSVTVDAKGRVTSGTNPTTLSGYGITDALSNSTTSTQSGYFGDIFLYDDSTPSHYLQITNSANLTAARTLSINVNNANRTVSLSGDLTVSSAATISGTNTGDQTITLTGDVTGTGTGSFATTLANTAVTPASYGSASAVPTFTVDSKGRLTAASNTAIAIAQSAVTNLTTDLAAKANLASPTFTGTVTAATLDLTTAVTSSTASHYWVATGSDGVVRPKTLANVRTEVVTNAAVNSAAATTVGTVTSGTWAATDVALAHGGTNASLTAAAGGIVYSTATAMAITSAGTAGQVLTSNGTGAPTWQAAASGGFDAFFLSGM